MLLYSPAYVVLITLFITLLSLQVSYLRLKEKIPKGNGTSDGLRKARRVHFLMLEYSAVFVPLLICSELMGASNRWIALCSLIFLLGRLLHTSAILSSEGFTWGRAAGTLLSHLASVALMVKLALTLMTIQV